MRLNSAQVDKIRELVQKVYGGPITFTKMAEAAACVQQISGSNFFSFYAFDKPGKDQIKSISNNPKNYVELYNHLIDQDYIFDEMVSAMKPATLSQAIGAADVTKRKDEFSVELFRARPVFDICYTPIIIGGRFIGMTSAAREYSHKKYYSKNDIQVIKLCCRFLREGFIRTLRETCEVYSDAVLDQDGNVLCAGEMLAFIFKRIFGGKYWESPGKGPKPAHYDYARRINSFLSDVPPPGSGEWSVQIYNGRYNLQLERLDHSDKAFRKINRPCIYLALRKERPPVDNFLLTQNIIKNFGLTRTELAIAEKIALGFSNEEIADFFRISAQTAKRHIYNIFHKTNVKKRSQLIKELYS